MEKKGYTLIEILIVLVIMGLLFAAGYANYRDFSRRQQVISAMRALRSDLRLAQEQAIEGKKPPGCTILNGYKFSVQSPNLYEIDASCTSGDIMVRTIPVPTGITISTPYPNPIIFNILGTGTNIPTTPPGRTVLGLTQTLTGNFRSIIIYATGEIKESTETPDPISTPTPTPVPTPTAAPPAWHYIGQWVFGCGTLVNFSAKSASQFSFNMVSGGGGDSTISYMCLGSQGLQANFGSYGWRAASGPCGWHPGDWTSVSVPTQVTVSQVRGYLGCNDGETAAVNVYYYGP